MKPWTEEECEILSANYEIATNKMLLELLPGRSPLSIYKKAYKLGYRKNAEIEFQNRSEANKGDKNPMWHGGVTTTSKGYRQILYPEHHRADRNGYVLEHIYVFERETGISVPDGCCIHHINGDRSDNRIENLCLMTHSGHTVMHHSGTHLSTETKAKIAKRSKERFSDKRNHPAYREVNIQEMQDYIAAGNTVENACKIFGIAKTTYYKKVRELKNAK